MEEPGEGARGAGEGPHRPRVRRGRARPRRHHPQSGELPLHGCLRAGAELLLLASAAQVLASTVAVLAPARPCALAATALSALTAYRAAAVLLMLAACHGHAHGAHAFEFGLVLGTLSVAFFVAVVVSVS